jgi:two-component system, NtrC family, response regulator AtoC
MNHRIAVVEDDDLLRRTLVRALASPGRIVEAFGSGDAFLERLASQDEDEPPLQLVMLDFRLGDIDGLEILRQVREIDQRLPVVMLTAYGDVPLAVEAMQAGATEFLQKPVSVERLQAVIRRHLKGGRPKDLLLQEDLGPLVGDVVFIGQSPAMRHLLDMVRRVGESEVRAILVQGETGTGKEIVSRLLHQLSPRCDAPFVPINSGAVMPSLLESEMFGYEPGAFTGADPAGRVGRIEFADGGTVFLDEIGDMDPALQIKLLRTLETGEVRRVGSNELRHVDVRFVAATHRNMADLVREERFRQDLYHRLSVVVLEVPPVRSRGDDVMLLAEHFLDRFSRELGRRTPTFSDTARRWLRQYSWPGNVREVRNLMERVALLSSGSTVGAELLGGGPGSSIVAPVPTPLVDAVGASADLVRLDGLTLAEVEAAAIERALDRSGGNVAEAARLLDVGYGALRHKLAKNRGT